MADHKDLYDLSKPKYDLSTYAYFYSTTSPLTLLASPAQLDQAVVDVAKYDSEIRDAGSKGLWVDAATKEKYDKAKQLVNSSIHPDTGKPVTLPFRMSAFVPTNLLICAGMLMPNPTLPAVIFWQWANQTLNVAVNHANANKSIEMTPKELGTAYVAATATSVLLAVGLTRAVPRLPLSAGTRALLGRLVPFVSVASAGVVNISCIRWKEMRDGVDVFQLKNVKKEGADGVEMEEEEKIPLGKSGKAGQMAVAQSAASRVLTNMPTLVIPPLVMTCLERRGTFSGPRGKMGATLTQLTLIGLCLGGFLPPAIAYFPQRASTTGDKLEAEYHNIPGKIYFNKGL